MCRRYDQNSPRRIIGHFPIEVSDSTGALGKWNFMHSTQPFQLFKSLLRGLAERLNGVPILRVSVSRMLAVDAESQLRGRCRS
jgi:hypothetical protein